MDHPVAVAIYALDLSESHRLIDGLLGLLEFPPYQDLRPLLTMQLGHRMTAQKKSEMLEALAWVEEMSAAIKEHKSGN